MKPEDNKQDELAADLIRSKIDKLYEDGPEPADELKAARQHREHSKHQEYMLKLQSSGKSMAEIQIAWHEYYQGLSDREKHQVWEEFYNEYQESPSQYSLDRKADAPQVISEQFVKPAELTTGKKEEEVTPAQIREKIRKKVESKVPAKHRANIKSLAFGLGCGLLATFIIMFGFYNERFITPFITPSRSADAAPLIIDPNQITVDQSPKIIIPKINVEVPVVYDEQTGEDHNIQTALENGVVKYASSVNPGEQGNVVIVGHSSNNLLNKGKYKFAFVWLNRLEDGDIFYLHKDGVRYSYKVFQKRIVKPTQVEVLYETPRPNTATLITCDPPGTAKNRLVVNAEQISPDPTQNHVAQASSTATTPTQVPGNAESLFQRFKNWLF